VKLLLLTAGQGNQRALAHRIATQVPITAIVTVTPRPGAAKKVGLLKRARTLAGRIAALAPGLPFRRAWFGMLRHYDRLYADFPLAPVLDAANVNAPEVLELVARERPELVVVSGTNLLKQPLIDAIKLAGGRIVNLHTGISPYIKGGPNCTNWCLALRRFDLIGNTIMWLDAGIDSGAIIATERTQLTGRESLLELHIAVMDHAHQLYVRCIALLAEGRTLSSVRQEELGEGRLFLTRHWTAGAIARALANFRLHYKREAAMRPRERLRLVGPVDGVSEA
jgi:methionyl-tRNA formyltransferase